MHFWFFLYCFLNVMLKRKSLFHDQILLELEKDVSFYETLQEELWWGWPRPSQRSQCEMSPGSDLFLRGASDMALLPHGRRRKEGRGKKGLRDGRRYKQGKRKHGDAGQEIKIPPSWLLLSFSVSDILFSLATGRASTAVSVGGRKCAFLPCKQLSPQKTFPPVAHRYVCLVLLFHLPRMCWLVPSTSIPPDHRLSDYVQWKKVRCYPLC